MAPQTILVFKEFMLIVAMGDAAHSKPHVENNTERQRRPRFVEEWGRLYRGEPYHIGIGGIGFRV